MTSHRQNYLASPFLISREPGDEAKHWLIIQFHS